MVFSLGALLLNLMNPLDCQRDIYSSNAYALDPQVVTEKLNNSQSVYSPTLIQLVSLMLAARPSARPDL